LALINAASVARRAPVVASRVRPVVGVIGSAAIYS
jgi:hypothetical protein